MDFKICVPVPAASDLLFDSEIKGKAPVDESPGLCDEEISKMNAEELKAYQDQHPTMKQFLRGE